MATREATNFYTVTPGGGSNQYIIDNYTPTYTGVNSGPVTGSIPGNSGDLSPGDTVDVTFSDPGDESTYGGLTYTYIGQVTGGQGNPLIFQDQNGQYYAIANDVPGTDTLNAQPTDTVLCFLAGTMIATPDGLRAVELLATGDLILTATGETRAVKWMGRQHVISMFAQPLRSYPVRIAAGALAEGVPARDLFVSPAHGVVVDGLIVAAIALVNGTTVTHVLQPAPEFTWFHIEVEDHAVILAEGAPVETFVDNVSRSRFDNYAEYVALYGEVDTAMEELDAPRVRSARQLPAAIRAKLEERAASLGFVRTQAA